MSDCKITSLPKEIIATILEYNVITIEDVINFRCVCKQFRYAAAIYNKFLEKKLFQRWPYAKKHYESLKKKENINFITTGINSVIQLRNYLSQILFFDYYYNNRSNQNYFNDPIENVFEFDDVMEFSGNIKKYVNRLDENQHEPINELKYMFYIEEIKCWLTQFPQGIDHVSIERYCNIKKSHYEKLSSIGNYLDRYIEESEREQLILEETCTFIAQLIYPQKDVCYTNVSASLDTIAQKVRNCLREKHPNHSIFSTSEQTFSFWKTNNIDENHWDETESTQIMDTLQEYIFGTLEFRACNCSPVDIKYLCIDYVLQTKYGQDIIVVIIFHSVARRLGLYCKVLDVAYQFSIFWKPKFVTNNLENARCFYIKDGNFPNCLTYHQLSKSTFFITLPILITIREKFYITDENFPNCLINLSPQYIIYTNISCDIAITTEMSVLTKRFVKKYITEHKIKALQLIRVNCNM